MQRTSIVNMCLSVIYLRAYLMMVTWLHFVRTQSIITSRNAVWSHLLLFVARLSSLWNAIRPEFCCQNLDIVNYVLLRDSTHIYTAHLDRAHIFMQPLGRTSLYILSFMETNFCHNCIPDGRQLSVRSCSVLFIT